MSAPVKDVFLHVGLPKTGTTSVQAAFNRSRESLRGEGLLFPGETHLDQRRAAYDLLGRRIPGDDEQVAGAFDSLVQEIRAFEGHTVLVSEELLGLARPRTVRRLVRALEPHRVHVVLGVRDLARTLPAAFQQEVVREGTVSWGDFVRAVRDPREGARVGVAFWLRHDPLRVLDAWESSVPRERVHLVTVPPPGSPPTELLSRFARVVGLAPQLLPADDRVRNPSLGVIGVEVVRRLNANLDGRLTTRQYINVIEEGVRKGLAEIPDRPLVVSAAEMTWVRERAGETVVELRRRGYAVEGDLDELQPLDPDPGARPIDDVDETELLHATEQALTAAALGQGTQFRRYRRLLDKRGGEAPPRHEAVASAARAAGFRSRLAALELADRNRFVGWVARLYLRRGSRRG